MNKKIIAICTANFYTETSRDMINAISETCKEKGFYVWVFNAFSDFNYEEINDKCKESIFDLLGKAAFSAIVILTPTIQNPITVQRIYEKAKACRVPVISYEMELEGCYNILFDYENAFSATIEHLIHHHGCRNLRMIAGRKDNVFSQERVEIYKNVLEQNNIPVEESHIDYGDFWDEPAMRVMQKFIDTEPKLPDAIVCANDTMAMAACKILKKNGYSVPEDIIVTGFDGIDEEKHHFPRLTTAGRDYQKAAQYITKIAVDFCEKQEIAQGTIRVPIKNVYSQSCGCSYEDHRDVNDIILAYQKKMAYRTWDDYILNSFSIRGELQSSLSDMLAQAEETIKVWGFPMYQLYLRQEDIRNNEYFPTNILVHEMSDLQSVESDNVHLEPDNMLLAVHWEKNELAVPLKKNQDAELCYPNYPIIVFSPILEKNQVYGYHVVGFPTIDDSSAHRLFKFTNHIAHMLSVEANKENLYRLNRELYEKNVQIEALYIRDPLTKIYNRRGFQQMFYQMLQEKKKQYVMLASLDLDGLKSINDTYGHKDGDFAILSFAEVLSSLCGENDFCARFGGDEFVFVSFTDDKEADEKFQTQLYLRLDELQRTSEKPYAITGSCGCCMAPMCQGIDDDVMLQKADAIMYEHKKDRKN